MLHQTLSFVLILASCVVAPCRAQVAAKQRGSVQLLGEFIHVTFSADDAFGYSLRLGKKGDQVFGRLAIYVGPPADPATGSLEDVTFDPHTRKFLFSARLSTAFRRVTGDTWVPTHDRFVFKGVLTRTEVTGTLQQFDVDKPEAPPISKRIKLRRTRLSVDVR